MLLVAEVVHVVCKYIGQCGCLIWPNICFSVWPFLLVIKPHGTASREPDTSGTEGC